MTEISVTSFESDQIADKIEGWLDNHPDFVQSYFHSKVSKSLNDSLHSLHLPGSKSPSGTPPLSGASTPRRKISVPDYNDRGLLKPLVNVVDGQPSFLSPSQMQFKTPRRQRKSREELRELRKVDERELLMELVKDIGNDLELKSLCHKILQNVSVLLNGDRCSLFLVQGSKETVRYLVSEVFDVNAESKVEDLEDLEEIRIPWGTGIVGYTADTGETVNIANAYEDSRFNKAIDKKTGYRTRSILCLPVKDPDGEVVGVAQVINKAGSEVNQIFTKEDEERFAKYLVFCGIGIRNAQLFEKSVMEIKMNQVLLDLARVIFEEQSTLNNIVHKIMTITQSLLQCERCSVFLVDQRQKGTFSQQFDLEAREDDTASDDSGSMPRRRSCKSAIVKFPVNLGITGYVARTGETLNIPDAVADERFDAAVDEASDFKTKTILCMPIKNSNGDILGVVQLINKLDGTPFNTNDENLFEAFAIFCGMAIHNTTLYENVNKAMAKQRVALEVLSYHATAPAEDAMKLLTASDQVQTIIQCSNQVESSQKQSIVSSAEVFQLREFSFDDAVLDDDQTCKAAIRMFLDLDLVDTFRIDYMVLCRWLLSVKKNYRNVTYHNWRHAFNVAQTMFAMLTTGSMGKIFTPVQKLALIVASLCHDLDHRGTNNSFQIKSASALGQLYGTSTMEHHHFDHCIMILNSQGNELFGSLTTDEYSVAIKVLEQCILATDLALYFKKRGSFMDIINSQTDIDWIEDENNELLRSMMMTACDVSAIIKPWPVQKRVARLVFEEFYEQGDQEKKELHITPIAMMNREKKDQLPQLQLGFIDSICMPIYDTFANMNDKLKPMKDGCQSNRDHWQRKAHDYENCLKHVNGDKAQ